MDRFISFKRPILQASAAASMLTLQEIIRVWIAFRSASAAQIFSSKSGLHYGPFDRGRRPLIESWQQSWRSQPLIVLLELQMPLILSELCCRVIALLAQTLR